jgi:hypothetical protein
VLAAKAELRYQPPPNVPLALHPAKKTFIEKYPAKLYFDLQIQIFLPTLSQVFITSRYILRKAGNIPVTRSHSQQHCAKQVRYVVAQSAYEEGICLVAPCVVISTK